MCSALLSPILHSPSAHADEARAQVMKKLAAALAKQANNYNADLEAALKPAISDENLSKLRPALNRQRKTLLTAEPLLGLLSSSGPEPGVSNEVVGSVSPVSADERPAKPMARFRQKLARLASGTGVDPLTILHIGSADVVSHRFHQSLATALQNQFGYSGHGMVAPARGHLDGEESSLELTKAGRWRLDSIRHRHKQGFGLSAMRATSRSSLSSMTITSKNGPFDWVGVTVATGPSQGTFTLKVGDVEREFDAQAEEQGSRLFKLAVSGDSATITPGGGAQTAVLNWSSGKKEPGVRYVHFDLLSDKTKEIQRLDAALIANDLRNIKPDLIVFDPVSQTGENGQTNHDLIAQIRASAPRADVLFLASDDRQAVASRSCLEVALPKSQAASRTRFSSNAGAATWQWLPSRADICAAEDQLQQGLVGADTAGLTPDYASRRATALANWLASPSGTIGKIAQGKID